VQFSNSNFTPTFKLNASKKFKKEIQSHRDIEVERSQVVGEIDTNEIV